jgi:integrase
MAGRPPLRIGSHGKITRNYLGGGVWLARCRFRDSDGVTRIVERRGPADDHDQHGKLAEDLLVEALASRKSPASGDVSLDTLVMALVGAHIDQLTEDGRAAKTLDTYRYLADKLVKFVGDVRVGEASPARLNAALRSMHTAHGTVAARTSKTLLRGGLQLAVMANVLGANPVRDVQPIQAKGRPKGASALTADRLRDLLAKVRASEYCRKHDVVDPITLFIATGLRLSELLGELWTDFDEDTGLIAVTGKIVRVKGKGLVRFDDTKSDAGQRTLPLPRFAIDMLRERRNLPFLGQQDVIFPSTQGTLRDPGNLSRLWRGVREDLGVPEVTSHSFRKTVATLIDDEGLSARIGADQLGHAKVSMTQDKYMSRGRVHTQVAELLDRTINDE